MTRAGSDSGPILFFDGVCNLCNGAVKFIIRHDPKARIRFAALQSPAGQAARQALASASGKVPDSLVLLENGAYYTLSTAALKATAYLNGGWPLLRMLLIVPAFLRNAVYRFIAANRYKWFGRQESCMLPTPELNSRFIR